MKPRPGSCYASVQTWRTAMRLFVLVLCAPLASAQEPPVAAFTTNPFPARGEERVIVHVPGDLDVDFSANQTLGAAPLGVRFRAVNVQGQALTGVLDFGDGATATIGLGNGRAQHTYTQPGVYTVTLTASDATDTDVEQKVGYITVTAPLQQR